MSTLGWIHVVFGLVALLAGTIVAIIPEGKRWHRTIGHLYLTTMLGLNVSSLFIYNLYGHWGVFHYLAVASLATLAVGMIPLLIRRPRHRWLALHAVFMKGSYIGLIAAIASEITTRLPGTEEFFGLVVGLTSILIIGIGGVWIRYSVAYSMQRTPRRFLQEM